jgi:5'-3' exonuclease
MEQIGSSKKPVEENLVRHMILNVIRTYVKKFKATHGPEVVIACDNRNYWRREFFPQYKGMRRKNRDASGHDWNSIFECLHKIKEELKEYSPYKVIDVETAEADDIIAVLAMRQSSQEKVMILSSDKDFAQLQKFSNVEQYSPILKKFIKEPLPYVQLKQMIIRGDKGDGIPNVLSADDSIVTGTRQKAIRQDKLDVWYKDFDAMPQDAEFKTNYERNRKLVSFDCIPTSIKESIINTYTDKPTKDKSKLLNFFVEHKMKNMLEVIEEF